MNTPLRQDLWVLAGERAQAAPADPEEALRTGLRSYRRRVVLGHALAVAVLIVLGGVLMVAHTAGTGTPGSGPATVVTLVDITVKAGSTSLATGTSEQLSAEGTYSDGTVRVLAGPLAWTSSATDVAVVRADGQVVAAAPGTVTITVAHDGAKGSTTLTVADVLPPALTAIAVVPAATTLQAGQTQQLAATGTYADGSTRAMDGGSWSSSDTAVATVDDTGRVTGVGAGAAVVTVSLDGLEAGAQVQVARPVVTGLTVTPAQVTLQRGGQQQFTATLTYSDGSTAPATAVTWTTSADKVVQIDAAGLATAVGPDGGQPAIITAVQGGFTGTATVQVSGNGIVG